MNADYAARSVERMKQADEEAALAAEAFAFGIFDEYLERRRADVRRRMDQRYGDAKPDGGSAGETGGGGAD